MSNSNGVTTANESVDSSMESPEKLGKGKGKMAEEVPVAADSDEDDDDEVGSVCARLPGEQS